MEILKKLLFLACIAPTSIMLGMEVSSGKMIVPPDMSQKDIDWYDKFRMNHTNPNCDRVKIERFTVDGFTRTLDFGAQNGTMSYINSTINNVGYRKYLSDMKFVDFFMVNPKENAMDKLHILFNVDLIEAPLFEKINKLTEQNEEQKKELDKFRSGNVQQSTELGKKPEQVRGERFDTTRMLELLELQTRKQKEKIEKLTRENEELKNSRTTASARKSTTSAKREEQPRSWLQPNNRLLSGLSVAAVMGGCMLLGASLYACFAK